LALAGIPHVAAYRIPKFEEWILRSLARFHPATGVRSVILANLVLGELAVPEFVQDHCIVPEIAPALVDVMDDTPARRSQIEAFKRLDAILDVGGASPSARAAQAVLDLLEERRNAH
jgi:lipid-A-disaccharide synthase